MSHNPTVKYKRYSSVGALSAQRYTLHAFTLIELMVVVAIIAILLMLLIPNIRTMREKAWSSSCQNNLRQYGIAMNQYMADWNGDFIYAGAGGQGSAGASIGAGGGMDTKDSTLSKSVYFMGIYGRSGETAGSAQSWADFIIAYLPGMVSVQSLSDGNPSVRVCPAVMQQIKKYGNFFDPDSSNFKGFRDETDSQGTFPLADFESGYTNNKIILKSYFTTYAINMTRVYRKNKKDIPENVVAFIDWNARDGWWATLTYTNWMFNGTNSAGMVVVQDTMKWTNAWWLTEVGFNHLQGTVYGANYVAMDGHVGWVGSNTIATNLFY